MHLPIYKVTLMSAGRAEPRWFVYDWRAVDGANDPHNFDAWSRRLFDAATAAECDAWIDQEQERTGYYAALKAEAA